MGNPMGRRRCRSACYQFVDLIVHYVWLHCRSVALTSYVVLYVVLVVVLDVVDLVLELRGCCLLVVLVDCSCGCSLDLWVVLYGCYFWIYFLWGENRILSYACTLVCQASWYQRPTYLPVYRVCFIIIYHSTQALVLPLLVMALRLKSFVQASM